MADHLLNNLVDLLGEQPEFHVHSASDARASEIIAHLDEGWSWRPEGSSEYSQWLKGRHLERGIEIVIFLKSEIERAPDSTARGRRVIAAANLADGA